MGAAIIIGVISVLSQNYDFSMVIEEAKTPDKSGIGSIETEVGDKSPSSTGKELSVEIEETMGLTAP